MLCNSGAVLRVELFTDPCSAKRQTSSCSTKNCRELRNKLAPPVFPTQPRRKAVDSPRLGCKTKFLKASRGVPRTLLYMVLITESMLTSPSAVQKEDQRYAELLLAACSYDTKKPCGFNARVACSRVYLPYQRTCYTRVASNILLLYHCCEQPLHHHFQTHLSARVLLPWSMCATIEKFRMRDTSVLDSSRLAVGLASILTRLPRLLCRCCCCW